MPSRIAGWSFAHLDGWTLEDKDSLLKAAVQALGLDDDRGASFDALSDGLAEVDPRDSNGLVLVWDGWSPLCRHDEQAFHVALSVLGGRAHADRGGPFAVLLRGEGPMIDVPELPARPEGLTVRGCAGSLRPRGRGARPGPAR